MPRYDTRNVENSLPLPDDKTEITPEMIQAGAEALCAHDCRFSSDDEAVENIFRAMVRAAPHLSEEAPRNVLRGAGSP